jgi:Adenylate kinase
MNASNNDRARWLQGPSAECADQADPLHQHLGACHLSTGDVFRAATRNTCAPSPAMAAALDHMRRGALVPDATVWEMVRERAPSPRPSPSRNSWNRRTFR